MKKLIALFAVSTMASTAAVAGIALSGAASVSYDDNGSSPSETSYDADLSFVGTAGGTTVTIGADVDGATFSTTGATLATTVGPLTITADMHDVDEDNLNDGDGDYRTDQDDTGVTVSLDAPIGDATVGLDNSGNVSVSGTFSGVTVAHTIKNGADTTTGSASIAGMDITLTNDAGSSDWSIGTTVAGTAVTLNSDKAVTATFGVTGNTVVVSHTAERAAAASTTATKHATSQKDAFTTVAISRALTSGATLAATYNTFDDSLTLKASVAF